MIKKSNKKNKDVLRCLVCNSKIKFGNLWIENINIEPITMSCPKCKYTFYEPKSTKMAITQIKIAYKGNNKIIKKLTKLLKKDML